ncbi:MAG TPA: aromatic ring-hydroxylating dioxygenase subunit alpha [Pirellulales bacterium]
MFVHTTRLPHLLPPAAYFAPQYAADERERVLLSAWHLVGSTSDVARDGDFLTLELLGRAVQVRNFGGELVALSNVCAHRHCLLSSVKQGHSQRMRCQYHGWEYGADGYTRRIPEARNFAPWDGELARLPRYRLATCGQLVFVSLAAEGPSLAEQLGPLDAPCRERFGAKWRPFLSWQPDYDANWKVPIENSIEAYHVPYIHPETFREDPGERRSEHVLAAGHTSLGTQLPFSAHSRLDASFQRGERWFLGRLGEPATGQYWQHHVFPNLLFSFTDAVSLCHCVLPTGPGTSRAEVRQFGLAGTGRAGRVLAAGWGRMTAWVTLRILREDQALYPQIQRGLEASTHRGVLGRCEERIHAFQQYVDRGMRQPAAHASAGESAAECSSCTPGAAP